MKTINKAITDMLKLNNTHSITKDIFGPPSLGGNANRDAHNLALLLNNMEGGIDCYIRVVRSLESKYGTNFKKLFLAEVQNG